MPLFFFDLHQRDMVIADAEGSDLPDLAMARREALVALRQHLADTLRGNGRIRVVRIEITDGLGEVLAVVPMEDAVQSMR